MPEQQGKNIASDKVGTGETYSIIRIQIKFSVNR